MANLSDIAANTPITANGDYDAVMQEHNMNINIGGTWNGAQVDILEVNPINTAAAAPYAGGSAITSNFTDYLESGKGVTIRFTVSGVGASTSLSISTLPGRG